MNSRSIFIVGAVVCAVLLTPSAASVARADDVRVFILAGQSNMTGTGLASELPPSLVDPQPDVRYSWRVRTSTTHASNEWGELRHFAGASPVGVSYGPELSFGRQMADAFPADDIAILKISANGTSLTNHWDPVTGDVYESMFDYADDALAQLADDGLNPIVEAFVWVQGSGDARSLDTAIAYEDNLHDLIASVRTRYGVAELPLLFNQYHADSVFDPTITENAISAIRQSQLNVATSDPHAWLVNVDDTDLRSVGDVHYTGSGLITMGRRLADTYLAELAGLATADFTLDGLVDSADLARWTDSYPLGEKASRIDGDANGDGRVDGRDFLAYQRQVVTSDVAGVAVAVPEPATLLLSGLAVVLGSTCRTRRRQYGRRAIGVRMGRR